MLVLSSAAAFGAMPALAGVAYAHGASPFTLLAVRFALAWALLAAVTRKRPSPPLRDRLHTFLLGLVGYGGASLAFFAALQFAPASVAAPLMYTYPALVHLAAALERRRLPSPAEALALGAAVFGSALVVGSGQGPAQTHGLGVALALLASVSYALFVAASGRITARLPSSVSSRGVIGGACVAALLGALATGLPFARMDATAWAIASILGVVCTAYAITALLAGIARVGPAAASVLSAVEPLTAVLLAWTVLEERPGTAQAVGAALVILAVAVAGAGTLAAVRPGQEQAAGGRMATNGPQCAQDP